MVLFRETEGAVLKDARGSLEGSERERRKVISVVGRRSLQILCLFRLNLVRRIKAVYD